MTLMQKIQQLEELSKEIDTLSLLLRGEPAENASSQPYSSIFGGEVIINHLDRMHTMLDKMPDKLAKDFDVRELIRNIIICSGYKKSGIPSEAMLMASHYVATTCMRNITAKTRDDLRLIECPPDLIEGAITSFVGDTDDEETKEKRRKLAPALSKACSIAHGWIHIVYKLALIHVAEAKPGKTKGGIHPEVATFMCYLHMLAYTFCEMTVDNVVKQFEAEFESMMARKRVAETFGILAPDNPAFKAEAAAWNPTSPIDTSSLDKDDWVVPEIEVTK